MRTYKTVCNITHIYISANKRRYVFISLYICTHINRRIFLFVNKHRKKVKHVKSNDEHIESISRVYQGGGYICNIYMYRSYLHECIL